MTEKELKKLNRYQLLELIILQTEQITDLEKQLEKTRQALDSQQIQVMQAGSIAEAALQLSGIFEAAQAAADTYLVNVQRHTENADRIEETARAKAEQDLSRAQQEADRLLADARAEAEALLFNARTESDSLRAETAALVEASTRQCEARQQEAAEVLEAARTQAQTLLEESTRKCEEQRQAVDSYIASVRESFHLQFQNLDQMVRK